MVDGYATKRCYTLHYQPEPPNWLIVGLTTVGACMVSVSLIRAAFRPGPLTTLAEVLAGGLVLLGAVWLIIREPRVNTAKTVRFFRGGPVRIEEEQKGAGLVVTELPYTDIVDVRLHSNTHKGVQSETMMLICRNRSAVLLGQTVETAPFTNRLWSLTNDLRTWISMARTHAHR